MTNGYQTIDRRPRLPCGCGCGQEATLPHFTKQGAQLILPGCLDAHRERRASQGRLREIVTKQRSFWQRATHCHAVYALQRCIFARQGAHAARRTALRSAVVYLVGQRVGLWVSMFWRKG